MKQQSIFDYSDQQSYKKVEQVQYRLEIDGASRNNPGLAGAGIVIKRDGVEMLKEGFFLASKTNNEAEYYALLIGLYLVRHYYQSEDTVTVVSDSQLLIYQMTGVYAVKKEQIKNMHAVALVLTRGMRVTYTHVLREYNGLADRMANYGIDNKIPVPIDMKTFFATHGLMV